MATNTYLGPLPGTPEYYAATKDAVFQGGAKYFTAQNPDTKAPVYLTRVGDEWQEVTKQEAETGELGTSSQRFANLGPGSYNINWLTQPNLVTNPNYAGGQIAFGASQSAGVEQSIKSQIPLTEEQKAQQIAQGQLATQQAQEGQIQAAGLNQEAQQPSIPFKPGLTPEQQASILNLTKKPIANWNATDTANWNYATGNAPLPGQAVQQPVQQPQQQQGGQGGLTPQQISELDIASQRIAQGQGTPTDEANVNYAKSKFGYDYQGQEGEENSEIEQKDPVQAILDTYKSYGIELPDPNSNPYDQYFEAYKKVYEELGLSTVKDQIDKLNTDIKDLQDKKDEEIQDINDNPWLTEGVRLRQINKVNERYEDKIGNLTGQFNLYQGMFENGVEEARFVANKGMELNLNAQSMTQELVFKAIDTAQKQADAVAKASEFNADRYRSVGTGLWDLIDQKWIVPPKATGGSGSSGGGDTGGFVEKTAIKEMNIALGAVTGPDGFVSPDDYTILRKQWIDAGGNATTFDNEFRGYRNPNNPYYITNKQ